MARLDQLKQMHALAEARRDADLAVMDRLRQQIRALEQQVEALERATIESHWAQDAPSPYRISGRDAVWDSWRNDKMRELGMQIARLSADLERQGALARRSVGRHNVIGKLIERQPAPKSPGR